MTSRLLHKGLSNTIFALATGKLPTAVAIVRVSGPDCDEICRRMVVGRKPPLRSLECRPLIMNGSRPSEIIDHAMVVRFEGPKSFTGEDVCEFHVHGSKAVVAAIAASLTSIDNVRAAEPGEFTRRAFVNGKLDLVTAEAINDLIASNNEFARKQALCRLSGSLTNMVKRYRMELRQALAILEAFIDFSEDNDLEDELLKKSKKIQRSVRDKIKCALNMSSRMHSLKNGLKITLIGKPNVGKSTLYNGMLNVNKSITSSTAGTTRDVVESLMDLPDETTVLLSDTAGIDVNTNDPIEREGVRRALNRMEESDVVISVIEACKDVSQLESQLESLPRSRKGDQLSVLVVNKIDLLTDVGEGDLDSMKTEIKKSHSYCFDDVVFVSGLIDSDMEELGRKLRETVNIRYQSDRPDDALASPSGQREQLCMRQGLNEIEKSLSSTDPACSAYSLREALAKLQLLDGVEVPMAEELLDDVFSRFCIGK